VENYDLIVIGLGAVGSAALCQSALRGARVLGIDRFHPPHEFGSSHGETRITRQAVGEGAEFVPLVLRANVLWRALEAATGEKLLVQNGGLILLDSAGGVQGPGAAFFNQTVDCARRFGIEHQMLGTEEMRQRFPQFILQDGAEGYLEPGAGFLLPEKCIRAQLSVARANRAELRTGETVTDIITDTSGVVVETNRARYGAASVVLAPGPWMAHWARTICGLEQPDFAVYRQTLYWFGLEQPEPRFSLEQMPIFLWSSAQVEKEFYGFPSLDGLSVKVASEQFTSLSDPDEDQVAVTPEQAQGFYDGFVHVSLRGLSSRCLRTATCLYTVVPDHRFVIGHGIDSERVWFASACSGHGFKHSAGVGEALAQKALGEEPTVDLRPFARNRTSLHPPTSKAISLGGSGRSHLG
jgi:sarcosine oxidase